MVLPGRPPLHPAGRHDPRRMTAARGVDPADGGTASDDRERPARPARTARQRPRRPARQGDAARGGLEHREALIYTLGKAAELEHLIMLQYLFAAFSLKQSVDEGLSEEALAAVQRWRKTLLEIAEQEMLHLALGTEPADGGRRRPAPRSPELPDAGLQLSRPASGSSCCPSARPPSAISPSSSDRTGWTSRTPRASRRSRRPSRCPTTSGRDRPAPPGVRHHRPALPVHPGRPGVPRRAARPGAPVRRAAERPGDRGALPLAGARRRHRPRVRAARHRHDRRAGRGRARRVARRPLRAPAGHPRRVPRVQAGGPRLRARPAGRGRQRPAAGHGRRGAAHHGSRERRAAWTSSTSPTRSCCSSCPGTSPIRTSRPEQLEVLADVSVGLMYTAIMPLGTVATTLPDRPAHAGRHRRTRVRALLPGRLPAPAPGGGVGPDGGAPARRGRVRASAAASCARPP